MTVILFLNASVLWKLFLFFSRVYEFYATNLIIIFVGEGLTQITVKETSAKNETQTSQQNNYKEDKYETQRSSSGHDQADRATSGQRSHSPVVLHERERPDKSNSPRYKAEMANKEFIHK